MGSVSDVQLRALMTGIIPDQKGFFSVIFPKWEESKLREAKTTEPQCSHPKQARASRN